MAAISITAANVVKGADATVVQTNLAGETVTAGQALYLKESDTRWWLSQSDGTEAEAAVRGVALNGASAGQPLAVQTLGEITIGGTVAVGTFYAVGRTAGAIVPVSDLANPDRVSLVGYGKTAAILVLKPTATGVSIP